MVERKKRDTRDQSLNELDGTATSVEGNSYLQSQLQRLRLLPLRRLRVEDLRLLIGQGVGLRFLVPIALEHVERDPITGGDFYPGDLLTQLMEVNESFWSEHRELRGRLVTVLEGAFLRIRKARTPPELEGEMKAALQRHRAALRGRV